MDKEITLDLNIICGEKIYSRADGRVLFDAIVNALTDFEKVIVEFNNKEIASESFLDEAVVEPYMGSIGIDVSKKIVLRGVTKPDQSLIKRIFEYRKQLEKKEQRKKKRT